MDKKIFLKNLGINIAQLRVQKGISISELARLCDKDVQSIDRVEKGNINPSVYYLQQLAIALEIPLSEIVNFSY